MASAAENRRGIIAMLAAMSLFVGTDAFMKLAREIYPAGQAIALRTAFAMMAGFALVVVFGETRKLALALRPLVLARGLIESAVGVLFIWALGLLPLATVTAILMASPLIIVVLAVLFRIEQVGWRRTAAIVVGFIGVLVVVRPTTDGFNVAALMALVSAVLVGCRDLLTRKIGPDIPSTVISLTTTAMVGIAGLGLGLFETWQPAWRIETLYTAIAAVLVTGGSFLIITAYRNTDVGVISGYRYSVVIFAVLVGYLVWGDVPDAAAFAGMALIVGSGLYTLHRQRVRPDSKLKIEGGAPR